MKRRIFSVVAGSVTALLIIAGTEYLIPRVFDLAGPVDTNDRAAVALMIDSMPFRAFLMILGGYILAAFAGGVVAGLVAEVNKCKAASRVGMVLVAGAILNFVSVPHPRWFVIASLAVYIPMAYFGGSLASLYSGNKTLSRIPEKKN